MSIGTELASLYTIVDGDNVGHTLSATEYE